MRLHCLSWRASGACCLSTRLVDGHQQVGRHSPVSPTFHGPDMRTLYGSQTMCSTSRTNFTVVIILVTDTQSQSCNELFRERYIGLVNVLHSAVKITLPSLCLSVFDTLAL